MADPRAASFGGFQSTLGAVLIAVILNTYLYGICTFQYASYYSAQFRDPRWIKWTLSGLFVSDTVHSVSIMYLIWLYLIDGFGNPASAIAIHWPLPLSVFISGSTAFIVQIFLAYRILLLSKMKIVVGVLGFLSAASFSFAVSVVVRVSIVDSQLARAPIDDILITCWLSLEVLVDLLLSGILLFVMRSASGTTQSDRIVKRLARMSVQTGVCSSTFALLCMILWLAQPRANWYLIFGLPVSRIYTSTLLDTLISRPKLRAMINSDASNGLVTGDTKRVSRATSESQSHGAQTNVSIKFLAPPNTTTFAPSRPSSRPPSRPPRSDSFTELSNISVASPTTSNEYAPPRRPTLKTSFPPPHRVAPQRF